MVVLPLETTKIQDEWFGNEIKYLLYVFDHHHFRDLDSVRTIKTKDFIKIKIISSTFSFRFRRSSSYSSCSRLNLSSSSCCFRSFLRRRRSSSSSANAIASSSA